MVENIKSEEKVNCWEFKKCGRGPTGSRVDRREICPTALEQRLGGVHGGINAGRACWVVAGTFCGGEVQGVFAKKYENCKDCEFYKKVLAEEGMKFVFTITLMNKLKN